MRKIWIPETEYYQKVSSHAQIRPQGAEKQLRKVNVVGGCKNHNSSCSQISSDQQSRAEREQLEQSLSIQKNSSPDNKSDYNTVTYAESQEVKWKKGKHIKFNHVYCGKGTVQIPTTNTLRGREWGSRFLRDVAHAPTPVTGVSPARRSPLAVGADSRRRVWTRGHLRDVRKWTEPQIQKKLNYS